MLYTSQYSLYLVVLVVVIFKSDLEIIPKHIQLIKEKHITPCRARPLALVP